MLWFSLRSIFTKYGWSFIRHIALPHPGKTINALFKVRHIKVGDAVSITTAYPDVNALKPDRSIVGVGFCMKPKAVPCPSAKDPHGCKYLEKYFSNDDADIPEACKGCDIKRIGSGALQSNSAFYIMTSARDILFDLFKPAADHRQFTYGHFVLCRYSFKPFFIGLYASGMSGKMYAFCEGDCKDYKAWIKADRGEKEERTKLGPQTQTEIESLFGSGSSEASHSLKVDKRGNIFYPIY